VSPVQMSERAQRNHMREVQKCIAAAGCCFNFHCSRKKVQNIEEAIWAISQNVKAFQAVRYDKKEQSKLRKVFAVYRLSRLDFTTWEIAILLDEIEPKIKQHIGEAFKHTCSKEESCWAKPFLSNYV